MILKKTFFSLLTLTLLGCTPHRVELCNIIDETPDFVNRIVSTPYSNNVNLVSLEGGIPDECHHEGVVIPNRTLKMAINHSLMRQGLFTNSPQSAYTLHMVLDPVEQISQKNHYQATTTLKATLRNRATNEVIFNERFETTLVAPDDSGFLACCRLKVATELSMRETIIKFIHRLKLIAYPPVASAHPAPVPPKEVGGPELL